MKKLLFFIVLASGLSYAECPDSMSSSDLMRITNLSFKEFGGRVNQKEFIKQGNGSIEVPISKKRQYCYCRQNCEFMANTWHLGKYQGHEFIDINFKNYGICRICKCNL